MNNDAVESVKTIMLECMERIYNSSVTHDYDDGDYFSNKGCVEDADNITDLVDTFNGWSKQLEHNNEQ